MGTQRVQMKGILFLHEKSVSVQDFSIRLFFNCERRKDSRIYQEEEKILFFSFKEGKILRF
jgi:hypothetical protein